MEIRQTHRQTDRHARHYAPLPYRGALVTGELEEQRRDVSSEPLPATRLKQQHISAISRSVMLSFSLSDEQASSLASWSTRMDDILM